VLIKGGARLEKLADVRCIAFDKTGTLTKGSLHVREIVPLGDNDPRRVLRIAASVEARSEHPIGRAIVQRAISSTIELGPVHGFEALPGLGAQARLADTVALVGSHRLFHERGLCSEELEAAHDALAAKGVSIVIVAADGKPIGLVGVSDEPRPSGADAVGLLRAQGVQQLFLLTGDHEVAARAVSQSVGLDGYRAALLPEDKVAAVQELRKQHGALAMIGDGVNDAPAIAAADVGIAMGVAGSDAALETADIALMADELLKIPYALRLSRVTARNIRANIAFSIVLKGAFLVMAVAGAATLWMAVAADMGASLVVIGNALRLLRE
jgi:Cd2+/Zn2+-exporting ATPase